VGLSLRRRFESAVVICGSRDCSRDDAEGRVDDVSASEVVSSMSLFSDSTWTSKAIHSGSRSPGRRQGLVELVFGSFGSDGDITDDDRCSLCS